MDYMEMESEANPSSILDSVFYVFEYYGWHLLILSVIVLVIYNKILRHYVEKYKQYKFEQEYSAKYHKNPDVFAAHVTGQQRWAEKMQEKYNKESAEAQKKMKEKEERKRQELAEKYSTDEGGHVLGRKNDDKRKNTLRPEYNPLMGGGSSSTYRPPRRSPCGGGGCGR